MTAELLGITQKLRSMGVEPSVLRMVRAGVRNAQAPKLDDVVIDRLREEISQNHRAILVLGRNGGYSVFSPEGHAALCANAKRNKPWTAVRRARAKNPKH